MSKPSLSWPWLGPLAIGLGLSITACKSGPRAMEDKFIPLQGLWEGDGAGGKCAITISGNSLNYQAGSNWWKTTFTLPTNTDPQQLHATIRDSFPSTNGIGTVVMAIFKIENRTLTLAEVDGSDQAPASFESASSRYVLEKVER